MMYTREPRNTLKILLPHSPLVSDVVENRTICGAFLADGSSLSRFWRRHKQEDKNQSTGVWTLD